MPVSQISLDFSANAENALTSALSAVAQDVIQDTV
jgi:hypothetical protein